MAAPQKYLDELRACAVRLYRESDPKPVIKRLAEQLGVHPEALRNWIKQDQADHAARTDLPTTAEVEELRRLRKEIALMESPERHRRHRSSFIASDMPGRPICAISHPSTSTVALIT